MAVVPAQYIKDAFVDFDGEIFAAAGVPIVIGSAMVPPPSLGVWSLLEVADCDFVHPLKSRTAWGAALAFYIMAKGKLCAYDLSCWLADGRRDAGLELPHHVFEEKVIWHAEKNGLRVEHHAQLERALSLSFSGYAMLPQEGNSTDSEYVYDLPTLCAVVAAIGADMGVTWDDMLWSTPTCVIGHVAAQKARQNGKDGVSRPKDDDDRREQFRLCNERDAAGELHPWQIKHPLVFGKLGHESCEAEHQLFDLQQQAAKKKEQADG